MLCKVLCRCRKPIMHPHRQSCEELGRWKGQKCNVVSLLSYRGWHWNLRSQMGRLATFGSSARAMVHSLSTLANKRYACEAGKSLTDGLGRKGCPPKGVRKPRKK